MLRDYVADYLQYVQTHHLLVALVAIGAGVLFLTNGWKLFKFLIAADAVVLGLMVGSALGRQLQHPHMDIVLGIGGGLIFAALVWPLMKAAVCVLGALFGGAVGVVLWNTASMALGQPALSHYAWAGGLIGLITMALLAFIIFRTCAVVVTSFQGAWLLVSGILCLALAIPDLRPALLQKLQGNPILVPVMMLIPGILGVIFQESKFLALQAKKRKAAMAKG